MGLSVESLEGMLPDIRNALEYAKKIGDNGSIAELEEQLRQREEELKEARANESYRQLLAELIIRMSQELQSLRGTNYLEWNRLTNILFTFKERMRRLDGNHLKEDISDDFVPLSADKGIELGTDPELDPREL